MIFEKSGSPRIVYHWPGAAPQPADLPMKADVGASRERWEGVVDGESAVGRFLRCASGPADSFFVVPWPNQQLKVIIAFGIRSGRPTTIPDQYSPTLQLAALAAWNAMEVHRLREELSVANERLGRRKLVERAKGLLQTQNRWSEQQAYEQLRKLSRQRRKTLAETAQDLLRFSRRVND